jgi:colanic acid/amylovoran biosynthesis glycosyltransferase
MEIAYLVNQYPAVSHTFIRREIQALERLDVNVHRFSLRSNKASLVDEADLSEYSKTIIVTESKKLSILYSCILTVALHPAAFLAALRLCLKLGRTANAVIKHLIYFVEACFIKVSIESLSVTHLHAHFGTNSATIALIIKKLGGPDYSFTVHGPEEFDKPMQLSLDKKIKHAKFVAAISFYGVSQLSRWSASSDWGKIKIVRCGLNLDEFQVSSDISSTKQLICVGRLCEQKAQLLLINAIANLLRRGVDVNLTLVGDGPMRQQVEQRIDKLGLRANIKLTGWLSQEKIRHEISHSRVLVLPSFAEGLPVVIMEALAMGRPVISTYIAGIPELIKHNQNGWLLAAGDSASLEYSIENALSKTNAYILEMGRQGRKDVEKMHDINDQAKTLLGYIVSD